jgi:hypothetical protein
MITSAGARHGIDLARSWVIGDILDDVEAGRRAGCRTVLINNGHESEWILTPDRRPHYIAGDLVSAAQHIVESSEPTERGAGLAEAAQPVADIDGPILQAAWPARRLHGGGSP